jgi:Cof subfamily protein (haloacid dehalogenase superfamily)
MPRYRLLAIDIDGTLVDSRHQLTDPVREALLRARGSGIGIVLATGRRYSRALPLVEPLGLDVPLVTASGALIKHPTDHRTHWQATMSAELIGGVVRTAARAGFDTLLHGDTFGEGFDFYCTRLEVEEPCLAEFLSLNLGEGRIWPALADDPPAGVFAGFAMGTREQMLGLAEALHRALPEQVTTHVLRSPYYRGFMCEIYRAGVSKWAAIRHLADEWQIPNEAICAVGDDVNDIPMIRAAGLGVAMGNALDEVKAVAARVAPSHDEHGLVAVVDWLLAS